MKIAIIQPRVSYFTGGGEIVALEQAKRLTANNDVTLVTTNRPRSDVFSTFVADATDVKVEYFDLPGSVFEENPGHSQLRWDLEAMAFSVAIEEFLWQSDFDLVVTHYHTDGIAIPREINNILHLHGFPKGFRELPARTVSLPMGYISVADYVTRNWAKIYSVDNVITVHNGIDPIQYRPMDASPEFDVSYIGRLIEIKGLQHLVQAVEVLQHSFPNIQVGIAGTGPYENELKDQISASGLSKNIIMLGYVAERSKQNLYHSSKVMCFPSYDREGVLTTMLEAAACGRPIVTTNCCGMIEYARHDHNAKVANPQDPQSLAANIGELLENDFHRSVIGAQARKDIEEGWTWDQKISDLEVAYYNLLQQ